MEVVKRFEVPLENMNVSKRQREVLAILAQQTEWSVKEVASILRVKSPAATKMLMRLEQQGLVQRKTNEWDRRGIIVRLSPDAEYLLNPHLKKPEEC